MPLIQIIGVVMLYYTLDLLPGLHPLVHPTTIIPLHLSDLIEAPPTIAQSHFSRLLPSVSFYSFLSHSSPPLLSFEMFRTRGEGRLGVAGPEGHRASVLSKAVFWARGEMGIEFGLN